MEENLEKNTSLMQLVLGKDDKLLEYTPLLIDEDIHTCCRRADEENEMFEEDTDGDYFDEDARVIKHIFTRKDENGEVITIWELELTRNDKGETTDKKIYMDKASIEEFEQWDKEQQAKEGNEEE